MTASSSARPRRNRSHGAAFDSALGWRPGVHAESIIRGILIAIVVLAFAVPFLIIILGTFSATPISSGFRFDLSNLTLDSWKAAYERGIYGYLFNSLVILGGGLLLQIATSIAASYALSRYQFKGAGIAFGLFLLTMMLPEDIIAVPLAQVLGDLPLLGINLRGTLLAVILPVAAWGFSVLVMTEFMRDIPVEIEEAARLDGVGHLRMLILIILPMSTPVLGVAAIFGFIMIWDQYFLPLIAANSPDDYTLTVALNVLREDPQAGAGLVMVGSVLAFLPSIVAYLLLQRSLIRGISSGATKG